MRPRPYSCLAVAFLLAGALSARADPGAAYYGADPHRLFWLVQVSDTHIGTDWYNEDGRFYWLLQEALPIIQPELVINTGDLVDASKNGIPASGQDLGEWQRYRGIVDQAGVPADYYIDLPGNHDTYDDDLSYYLEWSLNGSTYGRTTRALLLQFDFGSYFLYGCSTPGDSARPFLDPAGFSQEELEEMGEMLEGNADANLVLVFGHHPPGDPDRADEARALWRGAGAQYFHGHIHAYEEYLYDGVLARQVNSLGKAKHENLALIAVDGDFLTYEVTDSDDPWPFLVITAPADARLESGDPNPYAYAVAPDCAAAPVRALVFDNAPVTAVTCRAGSGPEAALERDPDRPMLWRGAFDTTGLAAGEVELTVTASGSQTRSRSIKVLLDAAGACPEPWHPPDGGPDGDGGATGDGDDGSADGGGNDAADLGADAGVTDDAGAGPEAGRDGGDGEADAADDGADGSPGAGSGCGCGTAPGAGGTWFLLLLLLLLPGRRRRG